MVYDQPRGYDVEPFVDLTPGWGPSPPRPAADPRHRLAEDACRREFGRRLVMVANVKGGSGKTTAALVLASVLGHLRGGGVLVWDNHETRGTLGHRAETGEPGPTVRQLLSKRDGIANPRELVTRELIECVRPQPSGHHVLASDQSVDPAPIGGAECGWLGALLRLHYDLVVMDSGSNVRTGAWQWGAHAADLLVIPVPLEPEAVRAAAWMCDHLEDAGLHDLARRAVVIAVPVPGNHEYGRRVLGFFAARTAAVVVVPADRRLAGGATVGYGLLSGESRRAWTFAAAAVAGGLSALPGAVVVPFPARPGRLRMAE